MTITEHIKTILRAVADGKQIQIKAFNGEPYDISHNNALKSIANGSGGDISVKPETHSINGAVFAAPDEAGTHTLSINSRDSALGTQVVHYRFLLCKDRDTAANAIIDALEGRTK